MALFIKFMFVFYLAGIVLRIVCIAVVDYPRKVTKSTDVIQLLVFEIPILLWVFYLWNKS